MTDEVLKRDLAQCPAFPVVKHIEFIISFVQTATLSIEIELHYAIAHEIHLSWLKRFRKKRLTRNKGSHTSHRPYMLLDITIGIFAAEKHGEKNFFLFSSNSRFMA